MTAPAGISPWLTYLERAMSSFRASATIAMRRVRPRSEPTRPRNQQVRALSGWYLTHIQASSIIVVRRHALPAFEMPCSWSMLPLFQGLGWPRYYQAYQQSSNKSFSPFNGQLADLPIQNINLRFAGHTLRRQLPLSKTFA